MVVFDNDAASYDNWYYSPLGQHVDNMETRCAFELLKPQIGTKILDVGCGTGNFSVKLAKLGCDVTGVDISGEMVKIAEKKAKSENLEINFHLMDVCSLNFNDNTFDAVISITALEFFEKPFDAIDEMFRVLKKEGHLLIGTINRNSNWGQKYVKQGAKKGSVFKYANFKTLEDLKQVKPQNLLASSECLYINPDAKDWEINEQNEKDSAEPGRGGFLCVLWRK